MVKLSELLAKAIQSLAGARAMAEDLERQNSDLKAAVGAMQGVKKPAPVAQPIVRQAVPPPVAKPYLEPVAPAQIVDQDVPTKPIPAKAPVTKPAPKILTPKGKSK